MPGEAAHTQRQRTDLRTERDRFVAFAFAAADLLLEVDANGKILFASGASQSLTRHNPTELVGKSMFELIATGDQRLAKILMTSLARGGRLSPVALRLADENASVVIVGGCRLPSDEMCFHLSFSVPVPSVSAGDKPGARNAKTGLLEKDDFTKLAIASSAEPGGPGKMTMLGLIGLNDLRSRVDSEIADGFMAAVGRHLRAHSSDGDSAGQLEDGRFGVLHKNEIDTEALTRHIVALSKSVDPNGSGVNVETTTLDLSRNGLSDADAARALIYSVNSFAQLKTGKLSITSLTEGLEKVLSDTAQKMTSLRSTLELSAFDLAFQPIVALKNREIHHYEALVRFQGDKSPADSIAFAEQAGLVCDLDLAICRRAIAVLDSHPGTPPSIAVNISGRSLDSRTFMAEFDTLLKEHARVLENLLVEVTETAAITRMEAVNRFLQDLRFRRIRVCLDDFGAGAASLQYLSAFAVDFVKIDGAYIRNSIDHPRSRAFLKSIASLCREIGTETIAEMVETEAEMSQLKGIGIDYGQGYLFGKPSPKFVTSVPAAPSGPAPGGARLNARRRGATESWG
jgi:EAL domain-containing protein (putative c-di-GMP-specific phosphodiesterase class I)